MAVMFGASQVFVCGGNRRGKLHIDGKHAWVMSEEGEVEVRPMVQSRNNHAVVYDEMTLSIYVFGGLGDSGGSLGNAEKYSLIRGEWKGLPKMQSLSGLITACRYQFCIYLMNNCNKIEIFYPTSCTYFTPNIQSPDSAFNFVIYNDTLYFLSIDRLDKWDIKKERVETVELAHMLLLTDLVVSHEKWCYLLNYSKPEGGKVEGQCLDLESAEIVELN